MNKNNNTQGPAIIILLFVGVFFFFPFIFITTMDGFSVLFIIPFIMILFFILFIFIAVKFGKQNNVRRTTVFTRDSRCTQCARTIDPNYKYCPHCGMEQLDYIVCEYCGHHNSKQNLQCEECNALIK